MKWFLCTLTCAAGEYLAACPGDDESEALRLARLDSAKFGDVRSSRVNLLEGDDLETVKLAVPDELLGLDAQGIVDGLRASGVSCADLASLLVPQAEVESVEAIEQAADDDGSDDDGSEETVF